IAGVLAIFSFGARGATLGLLLAMIINVFFNIFISGDYSKIKRGVLSLLGLGVLAFIVFNFTNLGNRIVGKALFDSSGQARLNVARIFETLNAKELLFGVGTKKIDYMQYIMNVPIIENFWVVWLLRFGLVLVIILALALVYFLFKNLHEVSNDIKISVLVVFFSVASTNNSLATSTLVISILISAIHIVYNTKEEDIASFDNVISFKR